MSDSPFEKCRICGRTVVGIPKLRTHLKLSHGKNEMEVCRLIVEEWNLVEGSTFNVRASWKEIKKFFAETREAEPGVEA